jgi:hypothetical protein
LKPGPVQRVDPGLELSRVEEKTGKKKLDVIRQDPIANPLTGS